jgi:small subunit ribosomal protein S19
MSRSLKKGPYINHKLVEKIKRLSPNDKTIIKTWDRGAVITPEMVGVKIGIHDGRKHVEVLIIEDMVGHKLGEFAPTRKFQRHGGRMAKEEEQAKNAKAATPAPEKSPAKENK